MHGPKQTLDIVLQAMGYFRVIQYDPRRTQSLIYGMRTTYPLERNHSKLVARVAITRVSDAISVSIDTALLYAGGCFMTLIRI